MMKYITIFIILFFFGLQGIAQTDYFSDDYLRYEDFVYQPNIRSVLLYKMGFEMSSPIVALHSEEKLMLSFDDLSADYSKYEYTIIHCDADWNPSDLMPNEYLESFTDDFIPSYDYSINTMQSYVHYRKMIPNDVISYKLSGNYLVKVYLEKQPDEVILTRRFYVIDPKADLSAVVDRPSNVVDRDFKQEITFSINTANIYVVDPFKEIKVTIRQNGRWDNAITNMKPRQVSGRELIYDNAGACVFDAGNDYRYFDIKSLRYNSMRVNAIEYDPLDGYQVFLHEDEVKNKNVYQRIQESMNGRFLIKTEDWPDSSIESEYCTVNFFLPYPTPLIDGKLYIFGGLTNWQLLREAELTFNFERFGFEAKLLLKQGYYNYHYILLPNNSKVGDLTFAEGNFFETNNEYTFYVYFRPQGSRYDQLVNVTTMYAFDY
ncbi:MAG: DUF5103 domain-containing protein [Bacteroidales bacterium]|nr:DUF5103 domain-containing protein [Bacteroidales bacterium]